MASSKRRNARDSKSPDELFELDADVANPKAKRSKAKTRRGNTHDPEESAVSFKAAVGTSSALIAQSGRAADHGDIPKSIALMISAGRWLGVAEAHLHYAEMGAKVDPKVLAEYRRLERSRRYWATNLVSYLGLRVTERQLAEGLVR